jgi:hypothetical protein
MIALCFHEHSHVLSLLVLRRDHASAIATHSCTLSFIKRVHGLTWHLVVMVVILLLYFLEAWLYQLLLSNIGHSICFRGNHQWLLLLLNRLLLEHSRLHQGGLSDSGINHLRSDLHRLLRLLHLGYLLNWLNLRLILRLLRRCLMRSVSYLHVLWNSGFYVSGEGLQESKQIL